MAETVKIGDDTYIKKNYQDHISCVKVHGVEACKPIMVSKGGRRKSRRANKRGGKSRKNRRRSSRRR
jgi:hypothetical protein